MNKHFPPRWPLRLLRLFLRDEYLEEIEGDMEERFNENLQRFGFSKSKRLYIYDLIKLARPILVKNIANQTQISRVHMYKNYLKTSVRNLVHNKLFSSINVIGLAISISVGILMILFLTELYRFDDFHVHKDNIYRINTNRIQGTEGAETYNPTASYFISNQAKNEVPGVEDVLLINRNKRTMDIQIDEYFVTAESYFVSPSFFDIFSFNLLTGNPKTALSDPNSIILIESVAKKLFKETDPLGKIVTISDDDGLNKQTGIITGVVEDPPINSHFQFEILTPLTAMNPEPLNLESDPKTMDFYVYLLLNKNTLVQKVESALNEHLVEINSTLEHPITHLLQPMTSIVTSNKYFNQLGPRFSKHKVFIMIGLTILVIFSACFNYTNLSLARALRRSKEVSIRKVIGATRQQVFNQFMVEAVLLSSVAFGIGLGLFFLIRPYALNIPNPAAQGYEMFSLNVGTVHLFYFLIFIVIIGCLAGFLPSLFLSRLESKTIVKDASKLKWSAGINLRRVLIVFQFTMSIGLITCAVLVYDQYRFSLSYDLGYDTENIINIPIRGDYINLLEEEYAKIPEVVKTSKSSMILGVGGTGLSAGMIQKDGGKPAPGLVSFVDQNFLEMHDLELLAGVTFKSGLTEGGDTRYIVVNEGLVDQMGLGDPQNAVGKTISLNGQKVQILGVVKNFISIALTKKLFSSFAFIYTEEDNQYNSIAVKIQTSNLLATVNKLEKVYQSLDPAHPFKANFYEDDIADTYASQKGSLTIVTFLALLATSISALGILGMAVYNTESKMKEICIRKILGANVKNLCLLLFKGFMVMLGIAGIITIPATLRIVNVSLLNEFHYRAEAGLLQLFSGFFVVLLIGLFTVGWQIREASSRNPIHSLRNE